MVRYGSGKRSTSSTRTSSPPLLQGEDQRACRRASTVAGSERTFALDFRLGIGLGPRRWCDGRSVPRDENGLDVGRAHSAGRGTLVGLRSGRLEASPSTSRRGGGPSASRIRRCAIRGNRRARPRPCPRRWTPRGRHRFADDAGESGVVELLRGRAARSRTRCAALAAPSTRDRHAASVSEWSRRADSRRAVLAARAGALGAGAPIKALFRLATYTSGCRKRRQGALPHGRRLVAPRGRRGSLAAG